MPDYSGTQRISVNVGGTTKNTGKILSNGIVTITANTICNGKGDCDVGPSDVQEPLIEENTGGGSTDPDSDPTVVTLDPNTGEPTRFDPYDGLNLPEGGLFIFSNNPNHQNLLIPPAIKADTTRVMDYINRLDAFNGPEVGEIAVGNELYEEAFAIFKKFDLHVDAMKVLLENLVNLERGEEYANKVDLPEVWSQLAKAYLSQDMVSAAVAAYIKAQDTSDHLAVIDVANKANDFDSMVKYLVMVRKKVKEAKVDSELCYAYAKTNALAELEEFITQPNAAKLDGVGDRCFDEGLYEAAKVLFSTCSNWGRLASTLVKLHKYSEAVDAARKANHTRTWKRKSSEVSAPTGQMSAVLRE